jgi:hypothetical protein
VAEKKVVTEFALVEGEGDAQQGVFSDEDLDVVKAHRIEEIRNRLANGRARPKLRIIERVCTYPVNAEGVAQGQGSSVVETEVS